MYGRVKYVIRTKELTDGKTEPNLIPHTPSEGALQCSARPEVVFYTNMKLLNEDTLALPQ